MAKKFIYVFTIAARDLLLKAGYLMLSADEANNIFIFANDSGYKNLDWDKIIFILSDTMTYSNTFE